MHRLAIFQMPIKQTAQTLQRAADPLATAGFATVKYPRRTSCPRPYGSVASKALGGDVCYKTYAKRAAFSYPVVIPLGFIQ